VCPDTAATGTERVATALEIIMLLMKMQEPLAAISKETRHAEESLFHRLEELTQDRPFLFDCTVQQLGDDEFVAVLSDHKSGVEVCAWSGGADGIVVEFEAWLDKRYPRPRTIP
jgi:hypothetical protein